MIASSLAQLYTRLCNVFFSVNYNLFEYNFKEERTKLILEDQKAKCFIRWMKNILVGNQLGVNYTVLMYFLIKKKNYGACKPDPMSGLQFVTSASPVCAQELHLTQCSLNHRVITVTYQRTKRSSHSGFEKGKNPTTVTLTDTFFILPC